MKPHLTLILSALLATGLAPLTPSAAANEPVSIIFDTDMGNDVDDAMALACIHNLEKRNACRLLAVTITKDHPKAAAFVDAINTFYGRPDVPIGVVKGSGVTPEEGKYLKVADTMADGKLAYPHDLKSGEDAPDATALLRKTLAEQPDNSVSLVQVGFFTNFVRLLESQPDDISPLSGKELIEKKVKVLVIMAGAFQTVKFDTRHLEYNVKKDIPSAQRLAEDWPGEIIWSGYEIGVAAAYPHESIEQDFDYVAHHPIKDAYIYYNPPPHDRPTWDLTAALYAIYPDRGYFELSPAGNVVVEDDSATWFKPKESGKHRFLILNGVRTARLREALVQLTSEPPASTK